MQAGDDRSGPAVDGAGQAAAFEPALGMERDPGAAWVLSIAGLDRRLEGAKLFGIHKAGSQSSLRRRMLPSRGRPVTPRRPTEFPAERKLHAGGGLTSEARRAGTKGVS